MSAKYFETFELKSTWILISKSDFYIFSSYSPMLTSIVTFLWQAKSKDCTKTSFHLSNKKHHLSADWLFSIWKSPKSQIPIGAVWIFGFVFPAPESGDFVLAPVSSRFLAPEGSGCPRSLFSLNMRWWSKACWTICEWHGKLPKANGSLVVELSIWPFKIP